MNAPETPPQTAAEIVDEFLRLVMIPDPDAARRYTAPGLRITFTGKRPMRDPADTTAFNKARYRWVKKRIERTETVSGTALHHGTAAEDGEVVYSLGTLYGEWPDGTPFEGNRYVDRYVVKDGLIVQMDVWNDSAEWLLIRVGLAQP
jgi:ketosteroid isomerase-like protein